MSLQRQIEGEHGDEDVTWASGWIQYREEDVVLLEWRTEPEMGWPPMTIEARKALQTAGHPRGILATLLDDWRARETHNEPHYCATALWMLHHAARGGQEIEGWRRLAARVQGAEGARMLRDLNERGVDVPNEQVRDDASPEESPKGPGGASGPEAPEPVAPEASSLDDLDTEALSDLNLQAEHEIDDDQKGSSE